MKICVGKLYKLTRTRQSPEYPFFVIFKLFSSKNLWNSLRAFALTDIAIHKTQEQQYEFRKQIILTDESLTEDEKVRNNKDFRIIINFLGAKEQKGFVKIVRKNVLLHHTVNITFIFSLFHYHHKLLKVQ